MEKPLVSVIMCVYNQELCVERAVESVARQRTRFPYEILLADDASSDATPEICRRLQSRFPDKIRLLQRPANMGIAPNYFDALRQAEGTLIADLAGDDVWTDPDKLQHQADVMMADESITICHSAWRKRDPEGRVYTPDDYMMPTDYTVVDGKTLVEGLLAHRRRDRFIHLCAAMYRRDAAMALVERHPELFLSRELPCEDFQLICGLAASGKVATTPHNVLDYSVGHASASSFEDKAKTARFAARVAILTLDTCRALGYDASTVRAYLRPQLQYALINAIYSDDRNAIDEAKKAIRRVAPACGLSLKTRVTLMAAPLIRFFRRHG